MTLFMCVYICVGQTPCFLPHSPFEVHCTNCAPVWWPAQTFPS